MLLADDYKALSGMLNRDIFAAVIDELIGWLNTYKTNDIIQFAGTLRLVCQYANIRIRPIALCHLNVVSRKQLTRLVMLGSPNVPYLRSITFRVSRPSSMLRAFLFNSTEYGAIKCLRVHDHAAAPEKVVEASLTYRVNYAPSLTELSVITSSESTAESFGWAFDTVLSCPLLLVKKLALFGIRVHRIPPALEELALSAQEPEGNLKSLCSEWHSYPPVRLRRIRLFFRSPGRAKERAEVHLAVVSGLPEDLIVEEVQPVGDDVAAWFAESVENGTIWTMPAVDLRGPPSSA